MSEPIEVVCQWCGKPLSAHDERDYPGRPVPRCPCGGLQSGFLAAIARPQPVETALERWCRVSWDSGVASSVWAWNTLPVANRAELREFARKLLRSHLENIEAKLSEILGDG